jgi:hypothetical protein
VIKFQARWAVLPVEEARMMVDECCLMNLDGSGYTYNLGMGSCGNDHKRKRLIVTGKSGYDASGIGEHSL